MNSVFSFILFSLMSFLTHNASSQVLPDSIFSGKQGKLHVQGVAVDQARGYVYFSFTDRLIKTDLDGNLIGSVTGIVGHLGDLVYDDINDKIYASLEYKNDAIGKGIVKSLGVEPESNQVGFYIAMFDASNITKPDISAEDKLVLKTIYLKEVVNDYLAHVNDGDKEHQHRYACSGIDGITLAPSIGNPTDRKRYIYVAYGIYGDINRNDNDHQVILKYDVSTWDKIGETLSQDNLHQVGPKKPKDKYFIMTGNTTYGIQNLAYDSHSGNIFAAVYKGKKPEFPNYSLFAIDTHNKPLRTNIIINNKTQKVKLLSLADDGYLDENTEIRGWNFSRGATGICPLGDGLFYFSHNDKDADGYESTTIYKYKWTGDKNMPFVMVK